MATIANAMKEVNLSSTSKTQGGSGSAALNDTDLVQLYDNAGNPNGKITKSALMDAVKASLPAILSDQTTTGVNFPSINSSGVLGKMTAANLASALGVPQILLISSSNDNANNYKTECRVLCNTTSLSTATNFPPNAVYGTLEVKSWHSSRLTQEYRGLDVPSYHYIRRSEDKGSTWSSWTQI